MFLEEFTQYASVWVPQMMYDLEYSIQPNRQQVFEFSELLRMDTQSEGFNTLPALSVG